MDLSKQAVDWHYKMLCIHFIHSVIPLANVY